MLVGHSQGGMTAAALAASPTFAARHHVTHLVTYGAPISDVPVPASVQVLSLEHRQDPVPRLDGDPNPRRTGWVTVTRDLAEDPDVAGRLVATHEIDEYAKTASAVDRSNDHAVREWLAGSRAFLPGAGAAPGRPHVVVREYDLRRMGPP